MTVERNEKSVQLYFTKDDGQTGQGIIVMESCHITALGLRNVLTGPCELRENIECIDSLADIYKLMQRSPATLLIMELYGKNESVLDGLRLIAQCLEQWPTTSIIVCTELDDPRLLRLLTASGIKGLVLKKEPNVALVQCIKDVMSGSHNYSHKVRQLLANQSAGGKALTARELEVLAYIFSGSSVTKAAMMMHRNVRTVSTHKRNAMHKLGFHNDGELFLQGKWMAQSGSAFSH